MFMDEDTGEQQTPKRSSQGRRRGDQRYTRIRNIAAMISIVVGTITIGDLLVRGVTATISVASSASQLAQMMRTFGPTVARLDARYDSLGARLDTLARIQMRTEEHDSVQLVQLKRTVNALNNAAAAISRRP